MYDIFTHVYHKHVWDINLRSLKKLGYGRLPASLEGQRGTISQRWHRHLR